MSTQIRQIPLDRLVPHPDNPNRMSRANFEKLVRNIERVGRYEPLVVRPCPGRRGFFQILNGHHRCEALRRLGHRTAESIVWNVDDEQTDILLATLNRLCGRDTLDRKLDVLRRLRARIPIRKLARLLPQTLGQLERLTAARPLCQATRRNADLFATPLVFFVDDGQQGTIEQAISTAADSCEGQTRAARRAAALMRIATQFLAGKNRSDPQPQGP
jgi:hypothetical protein